VEQGARLNLAYFCGKDIEPYENVLELWNTWAEDTFFASYFRSIFEVNV